VDTSGRWQTFDCCTAIGRFVDKVIVRLSKVAMSLTCQELSFTLGEHDSILDGEEADIHFVKRKELGNSITFCFNAYLTRMALT
jgi:hypothetical protein